jgi:6-hydroxycyclohex-1-ene-1-carbonyl-CoA dehydrogenase
VSVERSETGGKASRGTDDVEIALDAMQVHGAAGVGRVVRAGERADGLLDRRVLIGPIDPCGECDVCRRGGAAVCPHARRRDALGATVIAAARWLVPLDDGLALPVPAAAAVAGDVALAYTLYARTGVGPRDAVVVVGQCPIGRFLIEILRAKGIAPAALASAGPWADWLRARGVPAAADRAALATAFADQDHAGRPWRVLCADPAAAATAAALAGPRATLTVLAGAAAALPGDLLGREVTVLGVAGPHPDLVVEVAAMCAKGEIDLADGTSTAADRFRTQVRSAGERPD